MGGTRPGGCGYDAIAGTMRGAARIGAPKFDGACLFGSAGWMSIHFGKSFLRLALLNQPFFLQPIGALLFGFSILGPLMAGRSVEIWGSAVREEDRRAAILRYAS